jgi:N6-L-threonylcarbamoyladenine synthase
MRFLKGLATKSRNIVIAIESSCDDACLAILNTKNEVIYEYKYSQKKLHQPFGGVVPQLAAHGHRNSFHKILSEDRIYEFLKSKKVKCIAVTTGPGIGSCLSVGYEIAFQLSRSYNVPLVCINHLVIK